MKKRTRWLILGIIGLVLAGCGLGQPSITGDIEKYGDYPIADRKIALCQLPGGPEFEEKLTTTPVECTLLETVAVSDQKGHFEFQDVPDGVYLVFYDSGLGDFDATMEKWAGKTLRIGDTEWLLNSFLQEENPQMHLFSELANLMAMQGMQKTQQYMVLHFIVGESPFILAHDVGKMMREYKMSIPIAVAGKENQPVTFPALYLKRDE